MEAKERRSNVMEIQREPLRETKQGKTAESKKNDFRLTVWEDKAVERKKKRKRLRAEQR